MSIAESRGIAVRCNICTKHGPIIRFDPIRYRHVPNQPNHPNETYIRTILNTAQKEAFAEGFIPLIDLVAPDLFGHDDGPQVDAADNEVPALNREKLSRHICPACIENISESITRNNKLLMKKKK